MDTTRQTPPAGDATASEKTASDQRGPDLSERGTDHNGGEARLNRRLFLQLQVFTGCHAHQDVVAEVAAAGFPAVVYANVNDPRGVGLLTFSEDANHFVVAVRQLVNRGAFAALSQVSAMAMLGRTYSIGYEADLEDLLLRRPVRRVLNPDWPWAVWYPLRRAGAFESLSPAEQRTVLMEHGEIGRSFARGDLAHDIRLACHGLDGADSDFVVGLLGAELFPLSAIVQRMRKTAQTSRYLERLGPFFIGRVLWQARVPPGAPR